MRYLVQLVIPALIFATVVYLLTRRRYDPERERSDPDRQGSDVWPFLAILSLGAAVAIASAVALQTLFE